MSLLAVHLSDGALSAAWLAAGFAGAAAMLAGAMWKVREDEVPRIGVLTAAFFVASSVHIKLAVLPTSVHLILNGLVGVVLGRRAPLAVVVGITLQYLLLQHGGLTTVGINTCIVGVPALAVGALYPLLRRLRVPAFARGVLLGGGAVAGAGRAGIPRALLRRQGGLADARQVGAARAHPRGDNRRADARRAGELPREGEAGDAGFVVTRFSGSAAARRRVRSDPLQRVRRRAAPGRSAMAPAGRTR